MARIARARARARARRAHLKRWRAWMVSDLAMAYCRLSSPT